MNASTRLTAIKAFHTLIWAFFAGCILAIPFAVYFGYFHFAVLLVAIVFVEVLVIACNRGRCPLTAIAARYTPNRKDNFDIFLPVWLARHNKVLFGSLYFASVLYLLMAWLVRSLVS